MTTTTPRPARFRPDRLLNVAKALRESCSIDSCGREVHARGLCNTHYARLLRVGDPRHERATAAERFKRWYRVDIGTGCWTWHGVTAAGYGRFSIRNRLVLAHRFSYKSVRGSIPDGMTIDHLCRNKLCVNPDHLEPVTMLENRRRRMRPDCPRGHQLSGENLGRNSNGARRCRACCRISDGKRRERQRFVARKLKALGR